MIQPAPCTSDGSQRSGLFTLCKDQALHVLTWINPPHRAGRAWLDGRVPTRGSHELPESSENADCDGDHRRTVEELSDTSSGPL